MEELGLGSHVGFSNGLSMNEGPTCVVISAYSFCLFLATACCMDDADCLNLFFRANNYGTSVPLLRHAATLPSAEERIAPDWSVQKARRP